MERNTHQLTISFDPVHRRENNRASQTILDEKRGDLNESCWKVFKELMLGKFLNAGQALLDGLSGHLPRRIGDLREAGILIRDRWVEQNGKKHHHKEYWIDFNERERVMARLMEGMRFEKRKKAA